MHLRIHRYSMPPSAIVFVTLLTLDTTFIICSAHLLAIDQADIAQAQYWRTVASLLVAVLTMISMGLYSAETIFGFDVLPRIVISFALALLVTSATIVYVRDQFDICRDCSSTPIELMAIWFGWVALSRGAFATTFGLGLLKRRVAVLGVGRLAASIAEIVEKGQNYHFEPVAFVGLPGERAIFNHARLHWYDNERESFAVWGPQLGIEEVVVTTGEPCQLPVRPLLECRRAGIKIIGFLDFWERETGSVNLEALQPTWLLYSRGFHCQTIDGALKRALDIFGSLGLLLFTLPLQMVTACLIKLDSPGPVFYRQERVGLHGKRFMILKFRSMYADAEQQSGPRWAAAGDPRITRVGQFIRKLRIDELPQILNVLRGDMSLIGPRPERPFFVDRLTEAIPYYAERHLVRPGITGWAQVNFPYGASVDDARCKLSFDLYYVKNHKFFLDLRILARTVGIVLGLEGR